MYSAKTSQGIPRPLGMEIETTFAPDSKIHPANQSSKSEIKIPTPWHSKKGKVRLKTTVITRTDHATDNKRTIHQHAKPCMSKPARKSHMIKVTCKHSYWSFLILLFFLDPWFPSFPFSWFSFLDPNLECSEKTLSDLEWERERERENNERAPKLNWQKVMKSLSNDP